MSRIISIGTAVPQYGTQQSTILDFMVEAYQDETASRKLKILSHQSGISTRYSAVSDFNNTEPENKLYEGDKAAPDVETRLCLFKENAVSLAVEAINDSLKKLNTTIGEIGVTHLITVTCTGIYAPGLDSVLITHLNLPIDTFHISVNFMGCNAAFHALKLGDMIVRTDEHAKVMIVCVELCTLHFQPKNDHDNLLSNTIFGDGAAAVVVVSENAAKENHQ
ncbi:MAG TPA: type III polyketide synthase, partial [Prolixibacteraceae bacterium]